MHSTEGNRNVIWAKREKERLMSARQIDSLPRHGSMNVDHGGVYIERVPALWRIRVRVSCLLPHPLVVVVDQTLA